ncbi:unnamed protein product [Allacma fusca]|uniref:SHSP domain-containing protein n=1 Tax=Allacma fusca TaxID=39272 RepID=A0A8J2LGZ1_9HEXA|nr:unnamed protein product [Allacma fusca]
MPIAHLEENEDQFPFLDVLVMRSNDMLKTKVYRKSASNNTANLLCRTFKWKPAFTPGLLYNCFKGPSTQVSSPKLAYHLLLSKPHILYPYFQHFSAISEDRENPSRKMADKRIPVKLSDSSVLDTEFSSIRERFDAEMRRMEDEMSNFRNQLLQRQDNFFKNTSFLDSSADLLNSSSFTAQKLHQSSSAQQQQQHLSSTTTTQTSSSTTGGPGGSFLEGLNSPLIQDDGDGKTLKLRFDVSQYAPEEIVLKTVDNKLLVHAKHEEKSETKSVYREYNREFLLPSGVNPELIRSSLSKDGVLTVEAPLPQQALPAPQNIPIKF